MAFYGHAFELCILDELYERPGEQSFVLYGPRRVGKTILLNPVNSPLTILPTLLGTYAQ